MLLGPRMRIIERHDRTWLHPGHYYVNSMSRFTWNSKLPPDHPMQNTAILSGLVGRLQQESVFHYLGLNASSANPRNSKALIPISANILPSSFLPRDSWRCWHVVAVMAQTCLFLLDILFRSGHWAAKKQRSLCLSSIWVDCLETVFSVAFGYFVCDVVDYQDTQTWLGFRGKTQMLKT